MTKFKYSVIISYYNNLTELLQQFSAWHNLKSDILNVTEFIIVDDGSKTNPITCDIGNDMITRFTSTETCNKCKSVLESKIDTKINNIYLNELTMNASCACKKLHVRFYRIKKDIGFNNLGARNIGAFVALGDILVFLDMDCLLIDDNILHESFRHLSNAPMDIIYFSRYVTDSIEQFIHNRKKIKMFEKKTHPNAFAMIKKHFWAIGAFNEDLSGRYGTDYEFKSRVVKRGFTRTSSKHRILVINNRAKHNVSKKIRFLNFPNNHIRLPWEHVWSSISYIERILAVPESNRSVRVVPINNVSCTFPILDIPITPRSMNMAKNRKNELFGIPPQSLSVCNETTTIPSALKLTNDTCATQIRFRTRKHTKNTTNSVKMSMHIAKKLLKLTNT